MIGGFSLISDQSLDVVPLVVSILEFKSSELIDQFPDGHTTPVCAFFEEYCISSTTTSDETKFHQGSVRLQFGLQGIFIEVDVFALKAFF
jgi:hypothetical protein